MRKILFTLAALAMLMASCTQDNWDVEQSATANDTRTFTVKATMPQSTPDTRVSLEADDNTPYGIVLKWEANDVLKLCFEYNGQFIYKDAPIVGSSISADGLRAEFTIDVPVEIGDNKYNVYGVYQKKGVDYFSGENAYLNNEHARFEEGTKNYVLNYVEERGVTFDKANFFGVMYQNHYLAHPMLYFSQENISTVAPINLQHSGWMVALHFKNSSPDEFRPYNFYLYYEAYNHNKVWNGLQQNYDVKFDFADKTYSSDHLEYMPNWWGNAENPWSYISFDFLHYNLSFGGDVAAEEKTTFYRWLVSEKPDFKGFTGQVLYVDEVDGEFVEVIKQTPTALPAKTVQVGNVYHIYAEWDGTEFKFVAPFVDEDVVQDKDYPTFDAFPLDRAEWLNNPAWNSAAIVAKEELDGGTILVENEYVIDVLTSEDLYPLYERVFYMNEGFTDEIMTIWNDPNVGAWTPDGGNTWKLTNEFEALLEGAGFVFLIDVDGRDYYFNAEKELLINPRGVRFNDVLDGAPVFSINYYEFKEGEAANVQSKDARSKVVKELTKRLNKSDSKLNIIR